MTSMPTIATSLPLPGAVEQLAGRAVVGWGLSSREIESLHPEIRLRSMFAARVESERLLQSAKGKLQTRIEMARTAEGVTMDRGLFIRQMREELDAMGYKPEPKKAGTLMDLSSEKRLGLIWQMNIDQALGYAHWKTGMDPDILQASPAMELVRLEPRVEIRQWPVIWAMHGGSFYGGIGANRDYPLAPGRMIALRTSGIWIAINRFGVPWKPFDWGSGMGTVNVRRKEALELGVLKEGQKLVPQDVPYNQNAEASLLEIPPDRRRAIEDSMCGDVEIVGDKIRLLPPEPITGKLVLPVVPQGLSVISADAVSAVAKLSDTDIAKAMRVIGKTVAYQRLSVSAQAAGKHLDDRETVTRAMTQYLALRAGMEELIHSMRRQAGRDAMWGDMDFSDVKATLDDVTGGAP